MSQAAPDPMTSLRKMCEIDLPTILRNEQAAYTHPWSQQIFQDCLKVGYCCQTLVLNEQPIGHAVLAHSADQADLLNLCVAPDWQGNGFGRYLLRHMLHLARSFQIDTVFLEVRISNQPAINLYESAGFCETGQRRGYYPEGPNGREDALILAKPMG
jgi:ribosomal-protein-alanine N-acetyltransferase